ncbi:MAG: RCC1 domain-containing protein [Gemmatimonadota bacterium]
MKNLVIVALLLVGCSDPFIAESTRAYKSVATGGEHSCAVSEAGEAFCWGRGLDGELGIGVKENRSTPALVAGGVTFTEITAGENHTCALANDNNAYCWGWNAFFQRGNPLDPRDAEPVKVVTNEKFTSISAGAHHACALSVDSLAFCWGYNRYGQLGIGSQATGTQAIQVTGSIKFASISAGSWHTCALTRVGVGYCWGRNDFGQLGIGSNAVSVSTPTVLSTSVRFRQIDGGESHTCGVATDSRFWCWGSDEHGELGTGGVFKPGLPASGVPVPVSSLFPSGSAIFAGVSHTCAIASGGAPRCWGRGEFGQLANGSSQDHFQPQPVNLLAQRIAVTRFALGGTRHACALVDRSVYCWGTGTAGQLGVAQSTFTALPQRVHD